MSATAGIQPLLLEIDEGSWKEFLDRTEAWLNNVVTAQAAFRKLAEDVRDKLGEPHLKAYIGDVAEAAARHEERIEELFRVIGRDPAVGRKLGGTVAAKVRQGIADLMGLAGGASGPWTDLQQLLMASLHAMGAVGVAEQLGLALGLKEVVDITFPISNEKAMHHLLIKELLLETASLAILYREPI